MEGIILDTCIGFQWDNHNLEKNWKKHTVIAMECEEVFFNKPLLLCDDLKHSETEQRYFVLGKTNFGRRLFIAFTIRNHLIRVISARNMSSKEKQIYEKEKDNS